MKSQLNTLNSPIILILLCCESSIIIDAEYCCFDFSIYKSFLYIFEQNTCMY